MAMDFAYGRALLSEMSIHGVRHPRSGRFTITGITVDGQLAVPTREYWSDLFRRFRLENQWATGKSNARLFQWLVAHFGEYEVPYRIEWNGQGEAFLLPRRNRKMRRPRKGRPEPIGRCSLEELPRRHLLQWIHRAGLRQPRVRAERTTSARSRLSGLFGNH